MVRVTGLDLSLTGAGVARIMPDTNPRGFRIVVRRFTSKPTDDTLTARGTRLRGMCADIVPCAMGSDLVVIEQPSYGSTTGHTHDRSGLWWLVVATLTARGIPIVEVAPTTLKVYGLGKGSGAGVTKDAVFANVARRYAHLVEVNSNDEADALLLAALGARHLGHPVDTGLPLTHTRAMASIKWPDVRSPSTTT